MTERTRIFSGRLERFLAYLLDTIILILPSGLVIALFNQSGVATIAAFLVSLAYYTHFISSAWQATPGKRLMNLYVARTDKRPLTQRDALERFLAYSIPSLPIYASFIPEDAAPLLLFWLSMFWFFPILITEERTGLHDKLCRTRVLTGRPTP